MNRSEKIELTLFGLLCVPSHRLQCNVVQSCKYYASKGIEYNKRMRIKIRKESLLHGKYCGLMHFSFRNLFRKTISYIFSNKKIKKILLMKVVKSSFLVFALLVLFYVL